MSNNCNDHEITRRIDSSQCVAAVDVLLSSSTTPEQIIRSLSALSVSCMMYESVVDYYLSCCGNEVRALYH
jgi:hypothetical protein